MVTTMNSTGAMDIPARPPEQQHIFISYARKDASAFSAQLEADLQQNGFKTWRDSQIKPGVPFGTTLKAAIDGSFAMIAVVSPACVARHHSSYWTKCEWCYAISRNTVTIIPIVVTDFDESEFPLELFPMPRITMTADYEGDLEKIMALLEFAKDNPPIW